jgi:hypothetical protein
MQIEYVEGGLDFRIEHHNYDLVLRITVDIPSNNLDIWIGPDRHVNMFEKESVKLLYRFKADKCAKHYFYTVENYSEIFIEQDIGFYLIIKEAFDSFSDEALAEFTAAFEAAKKEWKI